MAELPRDRGARSDDPRLDAARYRLRRDNPELERQTDPGAPTPDQRAAFIEHSLQQAMRRGDFDDLPGAGAPLTGLDGVHDPDWWIRRKIETEELGGLGPPALTLRTEDAALDARLDRMTRAEQVREALDDFNHRVIEARRQLQGGPPVVTPTRDVEAELAAWHRRREAAAEARRRRAEAERAEEASLGRRERRRRRRERRSLGS